jgi:ankyrin repeat protein
MTNISNRIEDRPSPQIRPVSLVVLEVCVEDDSVSKKRPVRPVYILAVCIALAVIGRNLYHRYLNNAMAAAIGAGDVAAVRRLLQQGADANAEVSPGRDTREERPLPPVPVLTLACGELSYTPNGIGLRFINQHYNAPIVGLLIRHGANLQAGPYLKWACRAGDVETARYLLEHGVDVRTPAGAGALQGALDYGTLLENNPAFQVPLTQARTPAEKAQAAQHPQIARQLLNLLSAHGVPVTIAQADAMGDTDMVQQMLAGRLPGAKEDGYYVLAKAASQGDLKTMRRLLSLGVDPNRAPAPDNFRNNLPGPIYDSPLDEAVAGKHVDAIMLLLAHGADPNVGKEPPLTIAVRKGNFELAQLLLGHGADPNGARNDSKQAASLAEPPLIAAARTGNLELVQLLLAHGARINNDSTYYGSALEAAVFSRRLALIRYLLAHGATAAIRLSSLLTVALRLAPEVTPDLLAHGALVNLRPQPQPAGRSPQFWPSVLDYNAAPFSPLMAAVFYAPQYEAPLVARGAKIGPDRSIICTTAALRHRMDLLPKLLAYGADINGVNVDGQTALLYCIDHGPEWVRTLLEHGANPNIGARSNAFNPLQEAAMIGNSEVVRLLLAHGAQVNARAGRGHTALYWAHKKNHADVVALLQQAGGKEE